MVRVTSAALNSSRLAGSVPSASPRRWSATSISFPASPDGPLKETWLALDSWAEPISAVPAVRRSPTGEPPPLFMSRAVQELGALT